MPKDADNTTHTPSFIDGIVDNTTHTPSFIENTNFIIDKHRE